MLTLLELLGAKWQMCGYVIMSLYRGIKTHSGLVLGLLKSFWNRRANSNRMVTPLPLESAPYDSHCVTHKYKHMQELSIVPQGLKLNQHKLLSISLHEVFYRSM